MFALNQGEVCTCPSRALIQNSIIDAFLPAATERVKKIQQGNPLDTDTMMGAQASNDQLEKILSYIQIGAEEGARIITGGERVDLGGDLSGGYYVAPTIFQGHNKMRIFQGEIFGPVSPSPASTSTTTRSRSPTTPCTGWAPGSGRATSTPRTGPGVTSRPVGCGPTATTRTPRTRRSVATRARASVGRTTR